MTACTGLIGILCVQMQYHRQAESSPLKVRGCAQSTYSSVTAPVWVQLGFFGILLVEWIAGKGIFEMVGLNVGNGLGFEF